MDFGFGVIIDILCAVMGVALLVSPNFAYNFGSKEKRDPPKNWHITGRIIGAVAIIVAAVFFYIENVR